MQKKHTSRITLSLTTHKMHVRVYLAWSLNTLSHDFSQRAAILTSSSLKSLSNPCNMTTEVGSS